MEQRQLDNEPFVLNKPIYWFNPEESYKLLSSLDSFIILSKKGLVPSYARLFVSSDEEFYCLFRTDTLADATRFGTEEAAEKALREEKYNRPHNFIDFQVVRLRETFEVLGAKTSPSPIDAIDIAKATDQTGLYGLTANGAEETYVSKNQMADIAKAALIANGAEEVYLEVIGKIREAAQKGETQLLLDQNTPQKRYAIAKLKAAGFEVNYKLSDMASTAAVTVVIQWPLTF